MKVLVAQLWLTLCDTMVCSLPGSSVHGFSRQECWTGLPFPSPGYLPDPEIESRSPALQADALPSEPPGKPVRARPSFPHRQPLPSGSFPVSYPNPLEGGQNENHNQRKLIKLITWITALSNSMKIWAMACRATQDKWVMLENSDKKWSTGEGNANYFSLLALRTPWTIWKGKKIF